MIAKDANALETRRGILGCIGSTPLLRLEKLYPRADISLYAKLECFNPGGSAKDRPATAMLEAALREGIITTGSTVVESSSGNMGIGLAQACRYHGLRFKCVVDPHAQKQNIAVMKALGAEIIKVNEPVNGDYLTARLKTVEYILAEHPGAYWPNQYANLNNPLSHHRGTIREIDHAMRGEIDYLFVATSSTGTARGCRDYLRERGRETKVVAVDAEGSVLFGGAKGSRMVPGLGAGVEPELAQGQEFDRVMRVSDLDCVVGCRRAAGREAILVGGSAGGIITAVGSLLDELRGKICAAIFHDSGKRYLDTIYDDDWVNDRLTCSPNRLNQLIEAV